VGRVKSGGDGGVSRWGNVVLNRLGSDRVEGILDHMSGGLLVQKLCGSVAKCTPQLTMVR